jgi:hypothetical protein
MVAEFETGGQPTNAEFEHYGSDWRPGMEPPFNSMFEGVSSRAVRILRAKVGELEADVKDALTRDPNNSIAYLTADIALIADILAEFIEWTTHDTEPPWTPWVGTEPNPNAE